MSIFSEKEIQKGTKYCNMKTQVLPTTFAGKQKKRKQRKYSIRKRVILVLVMGILVGSSIYLLLSKSAGEDQLWMPFGYGAANVLSGSMEPTFSEGTLLIIKAARETKTGEIVVYQAEDELIVHRVVSVEGDIIVTKGDANAVCDRPFRKDALRGKVIAWIPHVGAIANILENVVLAATALILMIVVVRRIRNKEV